MLGGDPNDPASTWCDSTFKIPKNAKHEIYTGNFVHLILIAAAIPIVFLWRNVSRPRLVKTYAESLLLGFVLFSAYLTWQPWHTRLHLPLFVLWAPVVAVALTALLPRSVAYGFGVILLFLSSPFVTENEIRPLVGPASVLNISRQEQYFSDRAFLKPSYVAAVNEVRRLRCNQVGLDLRFESYEYPFLALLGAGNGSVVVRPVQVKGPSRRFQDVNRGFQPCAIICPDCAARPEVLEAYEAAGAHAVRFDQVAVFTGSSLPVIKLPAVVTPACSVRMTTGWYAREQNEKTWWRWVQDQGTVKIDSLADARLILKARLMAVQSPNQALLLLNGKQFQVIPIGGGEGETLSIPFDVKRGENTLQFVGKNPPVQSLHDRRFISIGVSGLVIQPANTTETCASSF
jgi:hypothetical protein